MSKNEINTHMVTKGGYQIMGFKKLEKPLERGLLKPHLYHGLVIDIPKRYNNEFFNSVVSWDEDGRCSNILREDCFIDVSTIKI